LHRDHYYIRKDDLIYYVYKDYSQVGQKSGRPFKWVCTCGLEDRVGHFCAHIARVILEEDSYIMDNISRRWQMGSGVMEKAEAIKQLLRLKMTGRMERRLFMKHRGKRLSESKSTFADTDRSNVY
jgi:hypothetical protein